MKTCGRLDRREACIIELAQIHALRAGHAADLPLHDHRDEIQCPWKNLYARNLNRDRRHAQAGLDDIFQDGKPKRLLDVQVL